MSDAFVFSLPPVDPTTGPDSATSQLQESKRRMGMIPNMYTRMANAPAMLHTYSDGYAGFRAESGFTPAEQEVVFLTISRSNGCEYCMAAHSFLADVSSGVPKAVTDALRDGVALPDTKLSALSQFTHHMVETRGRPDREHAMMFLEAGFSEPQILYIVLAIAVKTISNYSNHMFETPVDAPFAGRTYHAAASA